MLVKTKKWGNSLAILIPKKAVDEFKLKPNEDVNIKLEKRTNVLKELFGSIHFSKRVEELLKEARKNTSRFD
ncbi:MAG: AbrB/MazE/SpoVT family DNA-binding domain-containing protein [Nanoarchaeota archaeon]